MVCVQREVPEEANLQVASMCFEAGVKVRRPRCRAEPSRLTLMQPPPRPQPRCLPLRGDPAAAAACVRRRHLTDAAQACIGRAVRQPQA